MLEKISTPILIALLLYNGYHYYVQYTLEKSLETYRSTQKSQQEALPDKQEHKKEFGKEIVKVTDELHLAIGYALANSMLIIGKTGVIIVDTTESTSATKLIAKEFRALSGDKPLKGIVYTHNHPDHILGTQSFLDAYNITSLNDVEIWAHHALMDIYFQSNRRLGKIHFYRGIHQFGAMIGKDLIQSGIGPRLNLDDYNTPVVPPNHFIYGKRKTLNLAGLDLELIHIPGETDDQIALWWPERKALFCADDFYKAFPNLYAIRGTPFRSLKQWYESLDIMRELKPKILMPSHTRPIVGAKKIYDLLTDYRDGVQLVHDQTVRLMNNGLHPDEIASQLKFTPGLLKNPYLHELYGTIPWSSKGLFAGYLGWFSGDIVELNPHTPKEQAKRLVKLAGGVENALTTAETYLKEGDPQWALRLSAAALRVEPDNKRAKELKAKACIDMAPRQKSMNGYNYYMTSAYITVGKIKLEVPPESKKSAIRNAKITQLFELLSLKFVSELCPTLDKVFLFVFPDTNESVKFHVRNGVMDLSGLYNRPEDVKVTVDSVVWREILTGERSGLLSTVTSALSVEPSPTSLNELVQCFEKM